MVLVSDFNMSKHFFIFVTSRNKYFFTFVLLGGTDVVDQKIHTYSVKTKTKRWSLTAFSYTLDTARVNAQKLYMRSTIISILAVFTATRRLANLAKV